MPVLQNRRPPFFVMTGGGFPDIMTAYTQFISQQTDQSIYCFLRYTGLYSIKTAGSFRQA